MANLINPNSNKNYFQFHGSHYKYKAYLWDCLFPRSILKNMLQNLDCKFIKSSSKSKALIHPMGCPRRHCTPNLFISSYLHGMDLAVPCGNPSQSSQSFMHHRILCDLFHGIHSVQQMPGISNDDSQHRAGAQAVMRYTQVGTTWPLWQWQRGC